MGKVKVTKEYEVKIFSDSDDRYMDKGSMLVDIRQSIIESFMNSKKYTIGCHEIIDLGRFGLAKKNISYEWCTIDHDPPFTIKQVKRDISVAD